MIKFRPFQFQDLDALYAISLATGHDGGDASHLYQDGKLIGHIYSAPYAVLEPELTYVATDGGGVVGFIAGAEDTLAWENILERRWWPALRLEYADPGDAPCDAWTADQRRAFMIHRPERTPTAVAAAYPAHIHLNLLPQVQGQGFGSRLLDLWLDRAVERGAKAFHVGVNHANGRALAFWSRQGFYTLDAPEARTGRTVWMGRS
jgi:ribosomal protein S18 acetylase RimI-like enzyme